MIGQLGITTYGREAATYLNWATGIINNKWVTIGQLGITTSYGREAATFLNPGNWHQ